MISPDILCMVHKTKGKFIYSKPFLPQLDIIRFQKGSAISRYWAYEAVLCNSAQCSQIRHSYLVPRAALRKMTSQNYPMGSKMNSDGPQRTPVCPPMSQDACVRVNNSQFFHTKNTVKKMNYGHKTGCNLLPTDADGIISPDILCMVHKTKGKFIFSKQFLPQLHIIRFQKGSAIFSYWVLYSCIM